MNLRKLLCISKCILFLTVALLAMLSACGTGGDLPVPPSDSSARPQREFQAHSRQASYVGDPPVAVLEANPTEGDPPLLVNFSAADSFDPDGEIVNYQWDWEGDGVYDFDSGSYPTTYHTYTDYGWYHPVVKVTDNDGNTATDTIAIQVYLGQPPVAVLDAGPLEGNPPLVVTLDASDSSDPDGEIVKFEWDWEGDGHYDYDSGTNPTLEYTYTLGGVYLPTVKVTDDRGNVHSDSERIWVWDTSPGDWWMFGRERTHRRRSTAPWLRVAATAPFFTTGGDVNSSPAVAKDGTVYVGSDDYKLYAIKPDGGVKWSYQSGNWIWSSPAIGPDGTVYAGSYDNYLYAINSNGTLKWRYNTGGFVDSSPAIGIDGTVYVLSYSGDLYALLPDGRLKWTQPVSGTFGNSSSPAIYVVNDSIVIYVSSGMMLYAIVDLEIQPLMWWTRVISDFPFQFSSPTVSEDGTVYVGAIKSGDGSVWAFSYNGSLKWEYPTGSPVASSPAIGGDRTVYIGTANSGGGEMLALNPDGSLQWSFLTGGEIWSSPAIDRYGNIYFGSQDNNIYALKKNGSPLWDTPYQTGGDVDSSPAITFAGTAGGSGSLMYVGSNDDKIYVFAGAP